MIQALDTTGEIMQVWHSLKSQLLAPIDAHDRASRAWVWLAGVVALAGSVAATALIAWFLYRASRFDPFGILFLLALALIAVSGFVIGLRLLRGHGTQLFSSWTLVALGIFFLAAPVISVCSAFGWFMQHPLQAAIGSLAAAFLSGLCFLTVRSRRGV